MTTLIVGGDSVRPYAEHLMTRGFGPIMHWNGRNKSECRRKIPLRTRLVVILIDQVNHGLALKIRRIADEMALPVIFSTRSVVRLERAISGLENASGNTIN
jgi:hypothetical protein